MKCLATIYRSRFDKDKNLFMHPFEYLPRCGGTFIEKGKFKASYKSEDSYEEVVVDEGTVMIPGYYKPKGHTDFIEMPDNHYLRSCVHGWNLTSLEGGSILDCVFYPIGHYPHTSAVMTTRVPGKGTRVWKNVLPRILSSESLTLSDAVWVKQQTTMFFPKDWYIVIVKGNVLINDHEKKKREWINSSKDQEIQIQNLSDKDSLIFLLQ